MVTIAFRTPDGSVRTVDAVPGASLMRAAVDNGVEGIEAACGGSLACGTCHAYIADAALLPPQSEIEKEMLDYGVHVRPASRLTCQIPVTAEMEGLDVELPPSQR
jgi:2Fe-2S ferredoxin